MDLVERIAKEHLRILLGAAFFCAHTLPSTAASIAGQLRLSSEHDLTEARAAVQAFLPDGHGAYEATESGFSQPFNEKFVIFETPADKPVGPVARKNRIRCLQPRGKDQPWRCTGPRVQLSIGRHSLPQPEGIDDATLVEIAEFINSRCFYRQAQAMQEEKKWRGPPMGTGPRQIIELQRQTRSYSVSTRQGNVFSIERVADSSADCSYQLVGVGYWVN